MNEVCSCPICGGLDFSNQKVLWEELISDWQLSTCEEEYINKQQGFFCTKCGNNLRSMALANAILKSYHFEGTLTEFVKSDFAKSINVLEINEAGGLSVILANMPNHKLVRYPEYDMMNLVFEANSFELVLHSDTLEHVPNPVIGLTECLRVLKPQGRCIFTVPIIVGRMSRTRTGLKKSFHGYPGQNTDDFIVHTEFGADIWCFAVEAGFKAIKIHNFDYPAGLAIEVNVGE
jgi:SAM-dependent methyltransferase